MCLANPLSAQKNQWSVLRLFHGVVPPYLLLLLAVGTWGSYVIYVSLLPICNVIALPITRL